MFGDVLLSMDIASRPSLYSDNFFVALSNISSKHFFQGLCLFNLDLYIFMKILLGEMLLSNRFYERTNTLISLMAIKLKYEI